jgi:hypothetical protein
VEHLEAALGYSVDERGDQVVHVGHVPGYIDHTN